MHSDSHASVELEHMGDIAVLRLPDRKLGAFSSQVIDAFEEAVTAVERDSSVRCLVLTGGSRAFSVGAHLDELRALAPGEQVVFNHRLRSAFDHIADSNLPTVAAIRGFALGGGLELALACTFRIASRDAQLGLPEARLGILPGAGGTQRLPRTIGYAPALRMLLTGRPVTADRALQLGLVDQVAEDPVAAATELGSEIAESSPLAVRSILAATRAGRHRELADALADTEEILATLLNSPEAVEGMTAWAESRTPRWRMS